jgi:hypothetical protein
MDVDHPPTLQSETATLIIINSLSTEQADYTSTSSNPTELGAREPPVPGLPSF